jgi:hypothetical protein
MKPKSIEQVVYKYMFSKPKPEEPQNFHDFLRRYLVPEVRTETACFYGGLDTREAQYPGLDYSHPPHRMRLNRFPWHRRLFRAFDALGLTPAEIAGLTKWEGTKWAKERFERENGTKIRDTTGDGIQDWVDPKLREAATPCEDHECPRNAMQAVDDGADESDEQGEESDMEVDDDFDSVGITLNERLRAAVAQREAGDASAVMDEEWEQWLKEATELGVISPMPNGVQWTDLSRALSGGSVEASRQQPWQQVPAFLHGFLRHALGEPDHDSAAVSAVPPSVRPRQGSLRPLITTSTSRDPQRARPQSSTAASTPPTGSAPRRSSNLSRVHLPPLSPLLPAPSSWLHQPPRQQ